MQGETTFNDHASLDRDGDFRTWGLDRLPGSQEFPRVPVQVCSECPRCSRGPRCSYEHTFQPWAAITSEKKKRLKCNSMASVFPSFSHVLPAERLSSVPRASHPSSWTQESWLLPSPANTQVVRSHAQGSTKYRVVPESVGQFCTLGN